MRTPRHHRSKAREVVPPPSGVDLAQSVARAKYVGSPEHKDSPSFAGRPRPRADATICDRSFLDKQALLCNWLQDSLQQGRVGGLWEGDFPRFVWYREGDTVYEGRLINRAKGEYKGYLLRPDEWPEGLA